MSNATVAGDLARLARQLTDMTQDAKLFAARWITLRVPTHAQLAQRTGVSRETVRMILARMAERAQRLRPVLPHVDTLEARLRTMPSMTLARAERDLRALLGPEVSLLTVKRFATDVLGRDVAPSLSATTRRLVAADHRAQQTAYRLAHDTVAHYGATEHRRLLELAHQQRLAPRSVEAMLAERATHLDRGRHWIWFGPEVSSPIASAVAQVYEATGSLPTRPALIEAVRRYLLHRRFDVDAHHVPPDDVLARAIAATVTARAFQKPSARRFGLSRAQRQFVDALRAAGGIATKTDLRSALVVSGRLPAATYSVVLRSAPFIDVTDDTVALLGARR